MPPGVPGRGSRARSAARDEVEIIPEGAYLESSLRTGLASMLGMPEAQIDLAARLLDGGGVWAPRAPQRLTERVPDWLGLSPQEQSRQLICPGGGLSLPSWNWTWPARRVSSPGASRAVRRATMSSWPRSGWARLRLARLVAHLPAGQWVEIDSILRTVQGLQPGWLMEYNTRHDNPGSRNATRYAGDRGQHRQDPRRPVPLCRLAESLRPDASDLS